MTPARSRRAFSLAISTAMETSTSYGRAATMRRPATAVCCATPAPGCKRRPPGHGRCPNPLSKAARLLNVDCDNKGTKELAFYGDGRSETYQYDASTGWKPTDAKYNLPSGLSNVSAAA